MFRLKELRQEKGLTQKELATIVKLNQTAIGKYERGDLEPNFDTLKQFADFFDVSIDYLVGREDDFGVVRKESTSDKDAEELLSLYRELMPATQEAIKETIRQLVARQYRDATPGEGK